MVDTSQVQTSVRAQFPEVECEETRLLSQGCDFWPFEIDGRWVFRFPRGDEEEALLLKEFNLLDYIAADAPLPVPKYCFRGKATDGFPRRFGGYEKLPGEPGMSLHPPEAKLDELAHDLGRFLNWLHGFDVDRALTIGVPRTSPDQTPASTREWAMRDLPNLDGVLPPSVLEACSGFLNDRGRLPPDYDGPPRLLHGDYDADHILMDPATYRAAGIIDWGDACIGDPAWDFARVWAWQGDDFVSTMMQEYKHPLDADIWNRIRYPCVWLGLANVDHGKRTEQAEHVEHGKQCLHRVLGGD